MAAIELKHAKDLEKYEGDDWVWSRKWDGTFCQVDVWGDGSVTLEGKGVRSAEYGKLFPEIIEQAEKGLVPGRYLVEIVQKEKGQVKERFEWIQERTSRKNGIAEMAAKKPCSMVVFDCLSLMGAKVEENFASKRGALNKLAKWSKGVEIVELADTIEYKRAMVKFVNQHRLEGLVIRRKDNWEGLKWKPEFTEDVWWEGEYEPGKGKYAGQIGSLICYQWVDGRKVEIKTGGMTDELRRQFTDKRASKDNPMCIEVACSAYLPSGKLRHPRFKRMRPDKLPDMCVRRWVDSQEFGPGSTNTE